MSQTSWEWKAGGKFHWFQFPSRTLTARLLTPWWHDDDVVRARDTETFDLKATDGQSAESTGAHPNGEIRQECWRNCGQKGYFRDMLVSLLEPDINPDSNYIHVQTLWMILFSLCTEKSWASFQKAFLLFAQSLLLHGSSSFGWRKTHSSSSLLCTDNTLLSLQPPPPRKKAQKESGEMCHIPHDAHSYGNEDSCCRFFFWHRSCAEVVQGCITCQHLHPVEPSWECWC